MSATSPIIFNRRGDSDRQSISNDDAAVEVSVALDTQLWNNPVSRIVEFLQAAGPTPGQMPKMLWLCNSVIEAELLLSHKSIQSPFLAPVGVLPIHTWLVGAMTYAQFRAAVADSAHDKPLASALGNKAMVMMMDPIASTVDVHIAVGILANWAWECKKVNSPGTQVSILGLIAPFNRDNDDKLGAGHFMQPLTSRFSITDHRSPEDMSYNNNEGNAITSTTKNMEIVPDLQSVVSKVVECVNRGQHIVSFLPLDTIARVYAEACKRIPKDRGMGSLRLEEGHNLSFVNSKQAWGVIQDAQSLLTTAKTPNDKVSFVIILSPTTAFANLPIPNLGLIITSFKTAEGATKWNPDMGVTAIRTDMYVGEPEAIRQSQMFRATTRPPLVIGFDRIDSTWPNVLHGILHEDILESVFESVRTWPGCHVRDMPFKTKDDRFRSAFTRSLFHLDLMDLIANGDNEAYSLTPDRGTEFLRASKITKDLGLYLSFSQRCLLSGFTSRVKHEKTKRILIRMALLDKNMGTDPRNAPIATIQAPEADIEKLGGYMAPPFRREALCGEIWLQLGAWEMFRQRTNNFTTQVAPDENDLVKLGENITISRASATKVYEQVCTLERELCGLDNLPLRNQAWEADLTDKERWEVQVEHMFAFVNRLAVWDKMDKIPQLLNNLHYEVRLSPSALLPRQVYRNYALTRPTLKYVLVCGPMVEKKEEPMGVTVPYVAVVPYGLLSLIQRKAGCNVGWAMSKGFINA